MKTFLKILTLFISIGAIGGAVMLFKKHPLAYWVTFACGIILMLWIALEWYVWGFVAISNIYFVLGLVEAVVAWRCQKKA